ncbi:MAG: hypothetical protein IPI46_02320 [Bacteroidetes bacterium]|nr:hypothetical protein [Bacteroidota bacterium]
MRPTLIYISLITILCNSCTNNNKQTLLGSICDTTDTKFSTFVNPLITSQCLSCHSNSLASGGISLEGYDNVKAHYTSSLMAIKAGTMPSGAPPLDYCAIKKIEIWIQKGANNN